MKEIEKLQNIWYHRFA